jgi:outer membrane receptor protein involved in Fe transport
MMTSLRFLTGVAGLMLSFGIFAQNTPSDLQTADEAVKVLEPITVTGYHLKRTDIEGPAPVVVFDRKALEQAGLNTLEEFAQYLTINLPEHLRNDGAVGATYFDLRGIGIDTTLVLINGLRIAPYAEYAEGVIDINAIPVTAIDRIEILKDGASAIYGAEAVAGVVNIILRQDYDGIETSAGYGVSQRGDAEEILVDLVAGRANSRGSIMFSLGYFDREPQWSRDREWWSDPDFSSIGGPNWRSSWSSPPTLLRYDNFLYEADPACGTDPLLSSVIEVPWFDLVDEYCLFNYGQYEAQIWGIERLGVTLSGRYEINSDLSFFGDVLYSHVDGETQQAPSPITGSPLIETYTLVPYVPADHPHNPFGTDGEILARPLDLGNRIYINDSTAYRAVAGLEGAWGDWEWVGTAMYSRNDVEKNYHNMVPQTRFQQALLGQGGPNGDLWYNPFGHMPSNDPEIIDWLRTTATSKDSSEERSLDLLFRREFGSLPGGPAGVALGLQFRSQKLDQWADENLLSKDLAGWLGDHEAGPVSADREIGSAYVEFSLPILDSLEAQLALRHEDYSDFGSTTKPKIALRWQPIPSLMFRASYSASFRPPSFLELYSPVQTATARYIDTVRCEITGLPKDCRRSEYRLEERGNPDLQPEDGESWFAGMVWEPGFLPGFEFQLDLWKFLHWDRVEWYWAQLVLDEGGDFGIVREPAEPDGTPGRIILIRETYINTDKLVTRGFDTTMRYGWQTERAGDFRASLMHTYIDEYEFRDTIYYDLNHNYAGKYRWINALPRNRANVNFDWAMGQHTAAANIHYIGHYENYTNEWVDGVETDEPMIIPSHETLDLQYSYTFEKFRGAQLRIGCINCTDKDPPLIYSSVNEPFHDARGRYYYIRWQQPIR